MQSVLVGLLTLLAFQEPQERETLPPAQQLQVLQRELVSARRDYENNKSQAKTEQERKRIGELYRQRANAIAAHGLELARQHPSDTAAFDTLIWIVDKVRFRAGTALAALARDHINSERLIDACRTANRAPNEDFEAVETLLREAMAKSPHPTVRGFACFYLAEHLKERSENVRQCEQQAKDAERYARDYLDLSAEGLTRLRVRGADDLAKEAESLYERAIASYGDLSTLRKHTLGKIAEGELFDLRHLSVGKEAPEIVGQDVNGAMFKLGDYRGKVVVLTFAGNWCGPCLRMYPRERALVERLKAKPFALVSVVNDKDKATLRKAIESGEITWRCFWDGGRDGPICLRWGVNRWPTVFVLDAKGIIRFRDVRDEALDAAVETLLREFEAARNSGK